MIHDIKLGRYAVLLTLIWVALTVYYKLHFINYIIALPVSFVFVFFAYIIYMKLNIRYLTKKKAQGKASVESIHANPKGAFRVFNFYSRVKVTIVGEENIPAGAYVAVGNHQSNFDVFTLGGCLNEPIVFMSKKDLENFPLFGKYMKLMGCVFVDKDDIRNTIRGISQAIKLVKSGQPIVIFPEGKRSFKREMNEFQHGSFKVAEKSGAPILPISIKDTYKVAKRFPRKTKVTITIHEPIPHSIFKEKTTKEIADMTKEIIQSKI